MARTMADKGNIVLLKLFSSLSLNECIPYETFCKIFDIKTASTCI